MMEMFYNSDWDVWFKEYKENYSKRSTSSMSHDIETTQKVCDEFRENGDDDVKYISIH